MRIAVATEVTGQGGVDTYVHAFLETLRQRGHEVTLLVERDSDSPAGARAIERGFKVVPMPLYRRWHRREEIVGACQSVLAKDRFDGIHVVTGSPRSSLILRALAIDVGIPLAITESQVSQELELSTDELAAVRASYAAALAVVFVTSGNRDTMAKTVDLEGVRTVVIRNGIDIGQMAIHRKGMLRPELPARLISVARLSPEKSLTTLVSAVSHLPPNLVRELNIYGDGPARAELSEQVDRLGLGGRVNLEGWHTDVPSLLAAHDVFVLPSSAEGMPYALLEAMAVGLPAVCTDIPGNAEALAGGTAGLLVPRSDPRALADAIRDCLENPGQTEARVRTALSLVGKHHDRSVLMDQTARLWESSSQ